uniref:Uncharacterized protein n=1 Tax=Arundo donax TaxID=35708 RepID=A0A0A9CQG3_ARUDO
MVPIFFSSCRSHRDMAIMPTPTSTSSLQVILPFSFFSRPLLSVMVVLGCGLGRCLWPYGGAIVISLSPLDCSVIYVLALVFMRLVIDIKLTRTDYLVLSHMYIHASLIP